ncbi:DUF6894 family protein [Bosea sp. Root670]|uniref:DUF6894 family protein n=1 Tax=Bosea sp. Root670 TaxID=1736583 RepID=UPI000A9E045B|nr:hypothetical protein [Bosea sp. Root670]
MPLYRFITNNGGSHHVDLDLPSDLAARREARKAFAEAAHDALTDSDRCEMTMLVERDERVIYRGRISFDSGDVNAENDRANEA